MRDVPYGLCHCGCGQATKPARDTDPRYGHVKGEPVRFVQGHQTRFTGVDYQVYDATGCWVWSRTLDRDGYARVWIGSGYRPAHRVYYERLVGPIPEGLTIDHLCRNRRCVNPDHLDAVTHAENCRRSPLIMGSRDDV